MAATITKIALNLREEIAKINSQREIDGRRIYTNIDTIYNIPDDDLDIDPANGQIQYMTLPSNTTFTESLIDGESVTLAIDDGTAYTITWPTITWVKSGGTASAPTLATSGYTWIKLWKMSGTLYGIEIGQP